MEKRILGVFFSLLGSFGLIMGAANYMTGGSSTTDGKLIAIYLILGMIFFIAGISLIRSTKGKAS